MAHKALFEPPSFFAHIAPLPAAALPLSRAILGPALRPRHIETELLQAPGRELLHFLLDDPLEGAASEGSDRAPSQEEFFVDGGSGLALEGTHRALVIRSGPATTGDVRLAGIDRLDRPDHSLAWLPASRQRFESFCTALEKTFKDGPTTGSYPLQLLIWPHALGAVSDAPSLHTFLRLRPAWGFIFDPAALVTPAMLPSLDDHLSRLFDAFASHPRAAAALRSNDALVPARLWESCPLTQLTFIPPST
jgi:hypothetical protein